MAPASTIFTNLKTALSDSNIAFQPAILIRIAINLLLIACFPLGLKIYEKRQIDRLNRENQKVEALLAGAQSRLNELRAELKNYDHLNEKAKEFTEKKKFLKDLAESRLTIPRVIDLIENRLPKSVWLERLKLKISKDNNEIQITGKGLNEAYVNRFAGSLHDLLDENSITVDTRDIKEGDDIVKVDFSLKGVM